MRIKIGDKVYATVARDEVSLREMMLFNIQARDFGITWNEARDLMTRFDKMKAKDAENDPDIFLAIGVTIWMVRRAAGEDLTFSEAVDIDIASIEYLPDPGDHQPGKAKGAKKAPKKPRKASAPDSSRPSDAGPSTTSAPTESGSQSIPA